MIWYYTGNHRLQFATKAEFDVFASWVFDEIVREFPDHLPMVIDNDHPWAYDTDDNENRERIMAFCGQLLGRYTAMNRQ
jgi:hypothetical protein